MSEMNIREILSNDVAQVKAKLGIDSYKWSEHSSKLAEALEGGSSSVDLAAFFSDASSSDAVAKAGESAENLRENLFYRNSKITTAKFPNAASIGNNAFYICTSLATLDCPSATSIGDYAFYKCSALSSVNIPNVKTLGKLAFASCSKLITIKLDNVTAVGIDTFEACSKLTTVDAPKLTAISSEMFFSCAKLNSINIPAVTSVDAKGFYSCNSLSSIDLPNVTTIGSLAFYGTALLTIKLPKCTSLSANAFQRSNALAKVDLGENFTSFTGSDVFSYCTSLTTLILRKSDGIVTLGTNVQLSSIATDPANISTTNESPMYIYVPSALVDAYKADANWSGYGDRIRAIEDYPNVTGEG